MRLVLFRITPCEQVENVAGLVARRGETEQSSLAFFEPMGVILDEGEAVAQCGLVSRTRLYRVEQHFGSGVVPRFIGDLPSEENSLCARGVGQQFFECTARILCRTGAVVGPGQSGD